MKVYRIYRKQTLPISIDNAWEFFSSPRNLEHITPDYMNFKILEISGGETMYAGQIIRYKVNILPKIPVLWTTEITHMERGSMFVDEQRVGPYRLWHHQHFFFEVDGGVETVDEVHYALPMGFLGRIAHGLFVEKQLKTIFDYRKDALNQRFSQVKSTIV